MKEAKQKRLWITGLVFLFIGGIAASVTYFQETDRMYTIGISRWASNPEFGRSLDGFKEGLAEQGFIAGKNVQFIVKSQLLLVSLSSMTITKRWPKNTFHT